MGRRSHTFDSDIYFHIVGVSLEQNVLNYHSVKLSVVCIGKLWLSYWITATVRYGLILSVNLDQDIDDLSFVPQAPESGMTLWTFCYRIRLAVWLLASFRVSFTWSFYYIEDTSILVCALGIFMIKYIIEIQAYVLRQYWQYQILLSCMIQNEIVMP